MHHVTSALVAAFAGLTLANPINVLDERAAPKSLAVNIQQVKAGKKVKPAPALAMMNTYAKYGKQDAAPAKVKSAAAAAATQTGSVAANPEQYDEAYLSPVTVGSQTLNLDFDTGSADLWVYSTLQSRAQQLGHDVYNPTTSGKLLSGQSWSIMYGDGSGAAGTVYADKVVIGGVTATSQAVEAATYVSSQFLQDTANDGLVGLAFSSINTVYPNGQNTFFDTVKSTLKSKLFAVDLKKGAAGSYQFGYLDATKYTGAITYVPVDSSQGFWGFTASGYSVGSGAAVSTAIGSSIADTGTTLLYLPDSVVNAYWAQVSGATNSATYGGYVFSCSATLPSFTVKIGGTNFVIPGTYINYAPITTRLCFGGIQSNSGIGFSIFGDIFLKSVYAVFDQTQSAPRIGFAKQT